MTISSHCPFKLALFLSAVAFEDFFHQIGVTREAYVTSYQNDWSFNSVRMWRGLGIETTIYHFSRQVRRVETFIHQPTGCTIKFFPMPATSRLQSLVVSHHLLCLYLSSLSLALFLDLLRERPDVIYVQEYEWGRFDILVLFGKLLGIPVIGHHHGAEGQIGSRGAFVRRWAICHAHKLLCVNRREYERAIARYPGLDRGKLEVLYNPVDSAELYPMDKEQAKADLGLKVDRRYLLFVGRLHPHKGIPYLLEAYARIQPDFPDTELLLLGTGQLERDLRDLVARQGWQNIRFEGWIASKAQLRLYLAAGEFLVVPSLQESFCIAATEAMACGKAVLGTAVDGLREQIMDGYNGILVPPADSATLAEKMALLLEHPELCVRLGAKALSTFQERFSTQAIAVQMERILGSVVEHRR